MSGRLDVFNVEARSRIWKARWPKRSQQEFVRMKNWLMEVFFVGECGFPRVLGNENAWRCACNMHPRSDGREAELSWPEGYGADEMRPVYLRWLEERKRLGLEGERVVTMDRDVVHTLHVERQRAEMQRREKKELEKAAKEAKREALRLERERLEEERKREIEEAAERDREERRRRELQLLPAETFSSSSEGISGEEGVPVIATGPWSGVLSWVARHVGVDVRPADAPSTEAWALLSWARRNEDKFWPLFHGAADRREQAAEAERRRVEEREKKEDAGVDFVSLALEAVLQRADASIVEGADYSAEVELRRETVC